MRFFFFSFRTCIRFGTGEMTPRFRTLAALQRIQVGFTALTVGELQYQFLSLGIKCSLLASTGPRIHVCVCSHRHIHKQMSF